MKFFNINKRISVLGNVMEINTLMSNLRGFCLVILYQCFSVAVNVVDVNHLINCQTIKDGLFSWSP